MLTQKNLNEDGLKIADGYKSTNPLDAIVTQGE